MLTKARLIELGFVEKNHKGQEYLQKDKFHLFESGVGCWEGGYNDGEFAVVGKVILICTEDQLNTELNRAG